MKPDADTQKWMYETMVKSRRFEEMTAAVYLEGKQPLFNMANGPIPGEMHLSNGQEPVAVGVCAHLEDRDAVTATHRPHHIAIAKGVNFQAMTDEIFGKKSGLSGGRGGHMHLFDTKVNFVCSGIIAEGMGPAVGAALARHMRGEEGIAVAFIGEGAANQGAFHEAMNLAAVWELPFVCIIEDNSWGISVAKEQATAVARNDVRAASYGIPGEYVEGNDPLKIYEAAGRAIARARAGEGPSLIEVETYRLAGHFMGDAEGYRTAEEKERLNANDPIPKMRARLITEGILSAEEADDIEATMLAEVEAAFGAANAASYPAPEEALEKVFV
ncbi:thiamine pyrophosphate-dependent dehydrogenase E1 component subunit alpha [Emcibacter sp.]|uniref:thiamine pyrophosphate-dependent dehydrogenase E1 component subunit alpha n=1 Tax=Emcibacter sp. TaxID=1979954 RepID=UPI003A92506C